MGESKTFSSLAQFEARFGADPHPYAEYQLDVFLLTRADQQVRSLITRAVRFSDHG
jgi:hypothetical protein